MLYFLQNLLRENQHQSLQTYDIIGHTIAGEREKQVMDIKILGLIIFILTAMIALGVSHGILIKQGKSLKVWRIFCFVPLAICFIHYAFCHLRGGWGYTLLFYGAMYLSAVFLALLQFMAGRKYGYRVMAVLFYLVVTAGMLVMLSIGNMASSVSNFTAMNYVDAFRSLVDTMQEKYVLSEWKEIDYETLEEEILPMVEQAQQEQNAEEYHIALMTYCYRFYDSHVQYMIEDEACMEEVCDRLAGNDYGFSMITLDNGDTIAILAEEESKAYEAGIHDGTVITAWNGVSIAEAKKDIECIYPDLPAFPVAENEEYMKTIFLAGTGSAENRITFLDDDGQEQTTVIPSQGSYRERLEMAIADFCHTDIPDENFSIRMLTDDCGYLRISSEAFTIFDPEVSITGKFTRLTSMLETKLADMQAKGMTRLVIDLRNNTGGADGVGPAVASVFAEKEYFSYAGGKFEDGAYIPVDVHMVPAGGRFSDVEVVVLVNATCMSAGESIAEDLSKLPNVTLMGITTTSGVDQEATGWCFMPDTQSFIVYPAGLVLDENNEPRIDTRADRLARVVLDEHIPLTKEASKAIFGGNGDYELEYALNYLEEAN